MRYPEFLKENGTIGYVAPSFGLADPFRLAGFNHARERFAREGYGEKLGPNCFAAEGIGISNTPEKCAEELENFYCDEECDALISCGGGELMCETISQLDLERIKAANPKWYMGYSDNTNFTFLLATIFDTASIYGPCVRSFGMEPRPKSIQDAFDLMTGKIREVAGYEKWQQGENPEEETNPLAPYFLNTEKVLKAWMPDPEKQGVGAKKEEKGGIWLDDCRQWNGKLEMEGRLIGGCMDCLVNLLGTRFDHVREFLERYREDGFIWFLEACDLSVFAVRRAMWQMEEAGWFRYVKGFLIGRPLLYGQEMMGLDMYEAVLPVARKHQVPIIMDMDLGHLPPAMPIVCGSSGKVALCGNDIRISFSYR